MPLLEIKDPDVTDDAYRFYLITRTHPPAVNHSPSMLFKRIRVRGRRLKKHINGITYRLVKVVVAFRPNKAPPDTHGRRSPDDRMSGFRIEPLPSAGGKKDRPLAVVLTRVFLSGQALAKNMRALWTGKTKYDPGRYYMRGPGPKFQEKRDRTQADLSLNMACSLDSSQNSSASGQ